MYVVTVVFETHADRDGEFLPLMLAQARNSLQHEADCLQFDVCRDPQQATRFFLYEIYRDRAAFDQHLASPHFKQFDADVAPLVASKAVATYQKIS